MKALLIKIVGKFPFTHDIVRLNTEIEKKIAPLPIALVEAEFLSAYLVSSRYPGWDEPVSEGEYLLAVAAAEATLIWVSKYLKE